MKKHTWFLTLLTTLFFLSLGAVLLWKTGFFQAVTSLESLQTYIQAFSPYSHLVFFLLQLFSVIIAPIPSNITAMAGALLFGTVPAFLLTWAALLRGPDQKGEGRFGKMEISGGGAGRRRGLSAGPPAGRRLR